MRKLTDPQAAALAVLVANAGIACRPAATSDVKSRSVNANAAEAVLGKCIYEGGTWLVPRRSPIGAGATIRVTDGPDFRPRYTLTFPEV